MTAAASRKHLPGSPSPRAPAPQAKPATPVLTQSTMPTRLPTVQVHHISLNPRRLDPRNLSFKRWHDLRTLGRGRRRHRHLQPNWQVHHISLNPRHLDPRNLSFKRWHNLLMLGRGRRGHRHLQRNWQRRQLQWRWQQQCLQQLAGADVGFEVQLVSTFSCVSCISLEWCFIFAMAKRMMLLYSTRLRQGGHNRRYKVATTSPEIIKPRNSSRR